MAAALEASATGVGDIVLRAKYAFGDPTKQAALVSTDIRLPTGDEENLLGTGKVIRDAVREGGLDPSPLARSRRRRRICYPVILLAAILVMATFLIGGAVAKKLGLFALAMAFVLKFAKVIAIGAVAFGAGILKFFRRKPRDDVGSGVA